MNSGFTAARLMLGTWPVANKITLVCLEYFTDLGLLLCTNIVKYNATDLSHK